MPEAQERVWDGLPPIGTDHSDDTWHWLERITGGAELWLWRGDNWWCVEPGSEGDARRAYMREHYRYLGPVAAPTDRVLVPRSLAEVEAAEAALRDSFTFSEWIGTGDDESECRFTVPWDVVQEIWAAGVGLFEGATPAHVAALTERVGRLESALRDGSRCDEC